MFTDKKSKKWICFYQRRLLPTPNLQLLVISAPLTSLQALVQGWVLLPVTKWHKINLNEDKHYKKKWSCALEKRSLYPLALSPSLPVVFSLTDFLSLWSSHSTFSFRKLLSLQKRNGKTHLFLSRIYLELLFTDTVFHYTNIHTYQFFSPLFFSPPLHPHHPSYPKNKENCFGFTTS